MKNGLKTRKWSKTGKKYEICGISKLESRVQSSGVGTQRWFRLWLKAERSLGPGNLAGEKRRKRNGAKAKARFGPPGFRFGSSSRFGSYCFSFGPCDVRSV